MALSNPTSPNGRHTTSSRTATRGAATPQNANVLMGTSGGALVPHEYSPDAHTTNGNAPNGSTTNGNGANGNGTNSNGVNVTKKTSRKNAASEATASEATASAVSDIATRRATIGDIAMFLGAELVGVAETPITGFTNIESAVPGAILFIDNESLLEAAFASPAAAIIAPSTVAMVKEAARNSGKPTVLTGNPRLAFAKVMDFFQPQPMPERGIHATAVIESDAHIDETATVREGCYVGHHAHIGAGTVLYPHVVIGDGAQIGDECVLYPSVVINHHVLVGKRVRIHSGSVLGGDGFGYVLDGGKHHKVPQVGTVIIEDDVEIGANVCIDRAMMGATRVGAGTKIDNLVQVAHNVQIGRNCILCGQVGLSGSVIVEDGAVMAGQAGARDHVKIGKNSIVGAQAGLMADVREGDFVSGSPATTNRDYMKVAASTRKLPETIRTMRQLEKQVQALQAQMDALLKQSQADDAPA